MKHWVLVVACALFVGSSLASGCDREPLSKKEKEGLRMEIRLSMLEKMTSLDWPYDEVHPAPGCDLGKFMYKGSGRYRAMMTCHLCDYHGGDVTRPVRIDVDEEGDAMWNVED
mgnify:CR=1 FL=1